jgi:hypothetical protein
VADGSQCIPWQRQRSADGAAAGYRFIIGSASTLLGLKG